MRGKVYLVGSGPGSIDYLTVRAQQILAQAEVLIYDALVDAALLQLVPPCLKIDVGKRGGEPSVAQTEINQLLVEHCQQNKQVVRLKSGDPFIFGRCTAEIEALKAADCAFEVIPGLSSALVAPLLAGIPLTDPVLSRCFAILSAHDPDLLNWEALAQIETLVILMGTKHLPEIVEQLQRRGRSPHTPVAIIRWAGQTQQQTWFGTLANIVHQTARQSLSPAVITIGEVVALHPYLQPTPENDLQRDSKQASIPVTSQPPISNPQSLTPNPLADKTVLVTRSAGQSSQFAKLLQQTGATVLEMPALEIGPPSSWDALDQAIAHLSNFDWLILTSTNGVDYFFERLTAQGKDARSLAGVNIAVVGKKTANSLSHRGLQPDFIPPNFVADSLITHFPDVDHLTSKKILFPRVESGGRDVLVKEFTDKGAVVTEVAAYQSRCPEAIAPETLTALEQGKVDIITFASSKTVQCFHQMLGVKVNHWLNHVCIASIGPQTSAACDHLLGRVDIEAEEYTLEGLVQAIVQWARVSG
ncbi:uroporphyrinogen-III C-methyltransferase [Leptolyngbya sp. FACHB-541]|uniref:uroporphyrinogen-III C-methyltransferase n=1 Tax=Leptolyngbya sp. FACHB-541 TaxID=2692810 RepID=UPI0016895201|nr:uroporphyrinogen-III C-methyltransferase [Leptolyngbya sp. FACHB-541]MBD1997018.1 uroporphyrinogen-III C-methyltransferase [Leptolyngbya sp. FACHB-541]